MSARSPGGAGDARGAAGVARVAGHCDARFERLRDAFAANFELHDELGAALAVTLEGRPVVDLWAGWTDAGRTTPWRSDTLVNVYSVGKPMAALGVLSLVEDGMVELGAPVGRYWPEFAAAGKDATTVAMLLAHRAGLPALREQLPELAMYDWGLMTSTLAAEAPWWEPGSAHGYHVNTYGFLVGEIVRRVSGESPGAYFRRTIAEPLAVDFHFGLAASEEHRVAEFVFADRSAEFAGAETPAMIRNAYVNPPGLSGLGTINTRAWRAAEMPSGNGQATARAVARIYCALAGGGTLDGVRLLASDTLELATREASAGHDLVLNRPSRFGLGFQLTQPERPLGPSPRSYGHFGAGGSVGFADPDQGIGFGYTSNQIKGPRWQNPRNRALIDALYASL
jgi:CubicO group peptidase (beta-lactamase class C family)